MTPENLTKLKSAIIKIHGAIVVDLLPESVEDWQFAKTTPKKTIRNVMAEVRRHNDKLLNIAHKLRDAYELTKEETNN